MKKYKIIILVCIFTLLGIFIGRVTNKNNVYKENENNQIKKHVDTISMMLEKDIKSGNYEMTTRETWPTEGYVFNPTLSKCENGGELSWDDENKRVLMSGNVSDKCYVYFDKYIPKISDVCSSNENLASCVKKFGDKGSVISNIYLHNSSLENSAKDNSYRYFGANPDNYVCFGSTEEVCPYNNLYRIIGVFGNQVKLIKYDYATSSELGTDGDYAGLYKDNPCEDDTCNSYFGNNYENMTVYYWNYKNDTSGRGSNDWSTSLLNKTNLNTNFINNIGKNWSNKIAITKWQIGGNTWGAMGYSTPYNVYEKEILNPIKSVLYEAKIGLPYMSDFFYTAEQKYWTELVRDNNNGTNDYRKFEKELWINLGLIEWSITPDGSDPEVSFQYRQVFSGTYANQGNLIRPTFYLDATVNYSSGDGSKSNPIRIVI